MVKKLTSSLENRPTLTQILEMSGGLAFVHLVDIYQAMDINPRLLIPEIQDALDSGRIEKIDTTQVIHYLLASESVELVLPEVGMEALSKPRSIIFLAKVCGLSWTSTERILYTMLSKGQVTQDSGKWQLDLSGEDEPFIVNPKESIIELLENSDDDLTMGFIARSCGITRHLTSKILMRLLNERKVKSDGTRWSLA